MDSSDEEDAWLDIIHFHYSQLVPLTDVDPKSGENGSTGARKQWQAAEKLRRQKYLRKRNLECPLCGFQCSEDDQNSQMGARFLEHIVKHRSSFDPSVYKACLYCFGPIMDARFGDCCKQCSNENESSKAGTNRKSKKYFLQVLDYSCSVSRYMEIVDRAKSISNSRVAHVLSHPSIPRESLFKAVAMVSPYTKFVEFQKSLCSELGKHVATFHFKIKAAAGRHYWSCIFCTDNSGFALFYNDISMRLYALFHIQRFHADFPELMKVVRDEWSIMNTEFFCSVAELFTYPMSPLNIHRTNTVYATAVNEENKSVINEMFRREYTKYTTIADNGWFCKICFAPISTRALKRHLHLRHGIITHTGLSDFYSVDEIASESNMTKDNFPTILLRYSEQFRLIGDKSTRFYKWKCLLPCCKPGHIDDVLEFPSTLLLTMYALRHLENFHVDIFSDEFLEREWAIVNKISGLNDVDLRSYDQSSYENVSLGSDDPNDFVFPYLMYMLPADIRSFLKICGVCYWAGLHNQFLDHIVIHDYRNANKYLSSNSSLKEVLDTYGIKKTNEVVKKTVPGASLNILGRTGKDWLVLMKRGTFSLDKVANDYSSESNEILDHNIHGKDRRLSRRSAITAKERLNDATKELHISDDSTSCSSDSDSNHDSYDVNEFDEDELVANVEDFAIPNMDEPKSSTYLAQSTTVSSAVDLDIRDSTVNNKDKLKEVSLDSLIVQLIIQNMSALVAPPTLSVDNLDAPDLLAIQLIIDRRCPICPLTQKIRVANNLLTADNRTVEEAVFGHIILKHGSDKLAQKLLQIKCCQLLRSQLKFPPPFLLKADESGLLYCSVCTNRSFSRMGDLKSHFSTCVKKHCLSIQAKPQSKSRKITERETNECPLESCSKKWGGSTVYPAVVSQICHIINQHVQCAVSCGKALEISIAAKCKENAPYIDTEESLRETKSSGSVVIACAQCPSRFKTILELSKHSRRYHEIDTSNKCSFGCSFMDKDTSISDYVGDADADFFHHMFIHPDEKLDKWFETWPRKKELSKGRFKWDVQRSINHVSKHRQAGFFCSNDDCENVIITSVSDIQNHLHDPFLECIPSASAKRLVAACMSRKTEIRQEERPISVKRESRMDYRHNKLCRLCKKSITINSLYSCDQMPTFIHTVTCHPTNIGDVEWDRTGISLTFPFIDVGSTINRSREKGCAIFVCSICGFEFRTSKELSTHTMNHEGIVTSSSKRPVKCTQCSDVISLNGVFASEQFSIIAHAVNYHSADENFLKNTFAEIKNQVLPDDEDVLNLLDYEASLRMCRESGKSCMVCLDCRQELSNSLAFLHHSKQHIPRFVNKMHHVMTCFDRSRKPYYTPKIERMFYCHLCEGRHRVWGSTSIVNIDVSMMSHLILTHHNVIQVERYVDRHHDKLAAVFPFMDSRKSYTSKKLHCVKCPQTSFGRDNELLRHATREHSTLPIVTDPQETTSRLSCCSEDIFDRSDAEPSKNYVAGKSPMLSPEVQLNEQNSFDPADLVLTQEQLPGSMMGGHRIDLSTSELHNPLDLLPLRLDTLLNTMSANTERINDKYPLSVNEEQICTEDSASNSTMLGCYTPNQRRGPRRGIILSTASSPKSGPIRRHKAKTTRAVNQTPKTTRKVIRIGFDEAGEPKNAPLLVPEKGQTRIDGFLKKRSSSVIPTVAAPIIADGEVSITSPDSPKCLDRTRPTDNTCDLPSATHSQELVTDWLNTQFLSESRVTPRRIAEPLFLQDNTGTGLPAATNLKTLLDSIVTPDVQPGSQIFSCSVGSLLPSSRLKSLNLGKKEPADISHLENAPGFRCSIKDCMFVGLARTDTRLHMKLRHGETTISTAKLIPRDVVSPCIICKLVFSNRVKLLTHISDFHKNEKEPYPCSYCSKLFSTVARVREHERRLHEWSMKSSDEQDQYCSVCNERFTTARNVKEHMNRVHRKRPANDEI